MNFEIRLRWLLFAFALFNSSEGVGVRSNGYPLLHIKDYDPQLVTITDDYLENLLPTRIKRNANFEKRETEYAPAVEESLRYYEKRGRDIQTLPARYTTSQKTHVGWLPWHYGMGPVRRSFFIPRLGKRTKWSLQEKSPWDDSDDYVHKPITPAEMEYLQKTMRQNLDWPVHNTADNNQFIDDDYSTETFDNDDEIWNVSSMENDVSFDSPIDPLDLQGDHRITGLQVLTPLPKKSFSFSPRLGKKSYSFAPRLGKKSYSFAPRLGKKEFSFSPRLGKKSYSFAPRLGKNSYSFAPRLGKKSYTFATRLGKRSYSSDTTLGN